MNPPESMPSEIWMTKNQIYKSAATNDGGGTPYILKSIHAQQTEALQQSKIRLIKLAENGADNSPLLMEQIEQALSTTPAQALELLEDKKRIDEVEKFRLTILATAQPRKFMVTSMGKPSGVSDNLREAMDMAIDGNRTACQAAMKE